MKRIIYCFALICFTLSGKAQTTTIDYDTSAILRNQHYEGEWMYSNGQDTIRFFLRFHRAFDALEGYNSFVYDRYWGWFEYKKGNTIIQSNYQNRFANLPYDVTYLDITDYAIILRLDNINNDEVPPSLIGGIWDVYNPCKRRHNVWVSFNSTKTIMYWRQGIGGCINFTDPSILPIMTLPSQINLIKQ